MTCLRVALAVCAALSVLPVRANAADRLCDPAFQNCRTPLLNLINAETVGIDVSFWFMEDTRYSTALINRWKAGVPVRVLMDSRANNSYPVNVTVLNALRDAGIPLREKTSSGIVHMKMMLFAGQNTVQFSGANYSPHAFRYTTPYVDYIDEVIYFTDDPAIVNSFKRRYDDVWTTTTGYRAYANPPPALVRHYPTFTIDSRMNFPPQQNFATRSVGRYNAETVGIDSIIYRITDRRHTDALIAAMGRGVRVRVLTDEREYRNRARMWHSWNVDRLHAAGATVRLEAHVGLLHQKSTLLRGQRMTIFGSSNWTSPSASSQLEHNLFTTDTSFYTWFSDQFDRKWNNRTGNAESKPFVPLPPDTPRYTVPANGAIGQSTTVTLTWNGGLWAHVYDIYLGTSPTPPRLASNVALGPSESSSDTIKYTVSGLQAGTTYYWRIVSKTMAGVSRNGQVWSFHTGGSAPAPSGALPSGWQSRDIGAVGVAGSAGHSGGTYTLRGAGADVWGTSDAFRYAYRSLAGDATITARVASISGSNVWTKMGVMIRSSTSASSAHAFMLVSTGKGLAFQRRRSSGATSLHTSGGSGTAPRWVRLARSGNTITAFVSTNGTSWTRVGSDTFSMPSTVLVGLVAHSHTTSALATAVFDNVSIANSAPSPTASLPSGWQSRDIGAVGIAGSASASGGTYTVRGAGADVWGTADAFHFAHRALSGDGTITARVASISGSNVWTKMGVMIRASTAANAAHAFMLVSTGKGLAFQRRRSTGATSLHTSGGSGTAPRWVRLVRTANTITAYVSSTGSSWTRVGSDTFSMASSAIVGLAASSHTTAALARATFDNVTVK
jgi:phosphatidylserine/phosphatidylglycerophosphate/cardiolipin synthase-like enzyme/regulation of enolase protein 1 (concanavalin A-like superfamily)